MNIQKINPGALAIYIEENELNQYGLEPGTLDRDGARRILMNAKDEADLQSFADMELDVFPGVGSVLLFARMCRLKTLFFAFAGLEELISGVKLCREEKISCLTYLDGTYFLSVRVKEDEEPPACLREFGDFLAYSPMFSGHLEEYGERLISENAISVIKKHF